MCVYLIEGDRVCNPDTTVIPDMYGGIELGEYGDPVAYWIAKHHPRVHPALSRGSGNEYRLMARKRGDVMFSMSCRIGSGLDSGAVFLSGSGY
ncbi:phage portal protein [Salmonella enterica]|uniref:phage portal protein n=1 Tax=Salmonella enterica TaxID=28901 RepID=UPI001F050E09|nr:phage portal protein [Salmonella enterica]